MIAGNPVETIVSDGQTVVLLSHTGRHEKKTYHTGNAGLNHFIHVPVKMSDVIAMLTGKLNIRPFDQSKLITDHSRFEDDKTAVVIKLRQNWGNLSQTIALDRDNRVIQINNKSTEGDLLYQVRITGYKRFESDILPSDTTISDLRGRNVRLTILQFESNPEIADPVFQL